MSKSVDFDINSYLFLYSFCSMYLRCLRRHYPAITPKCIIRTWSISVKNKHTLRGKCPMIVPVLFTAIAYRSWMLCGSLTHSSTSRAALYIQGSLECSNLFRTFFLWNIFNLNIFQFTVVSRQLSIGAASISTCCTVLVSGAALNTFSMFATTRMV